MDQINKTVNIRSCFNFATGYKTLLDTIIDNFPKYGISVSLIYLNIPRNTTKYDCYFNDTRFYDLSNTELLISPPIKEVDVSSPLCRLNLNRKRTLLTMWESSALSFPFVEEANKVGQLIVPNHWNEYHFKRCGVNVPITVIPLFVDDKIFNYTSPNNGDEFIFGTGNGDPRKQIDIVVRCFLKAFPKEKDVRLKIKVGSHDQKFCFVDKRVETIYKEISVLDMVNWYKSIDVFVSGVTAEGWGFMQQESMACGRPVIASKYAGLAEFFNEDNGFPLSYKEVPSTGYWEVPGGRWSNFDENDMIETMRFCYKNRNIVSKKGIIASRHACELNIDKFMKSLIKTLNI